MRTGRRTIAGMAALGLVAALALPVNHPMPAAADGNEAPAAPASARHLTAGGTHTCVVISANVYCWGGNGSGQLGINDTIDRGDVPGGLGYFQPITQLGTGRTATALSAGGDHTCALLDNGTVKCWGANGSGQLGLGNTTARGDGIGAMGDSLPAVSLGTGRTALAVAAGANHTCALLDNHQVKCWGANALGQLGLGDTNPRGDGANELGDNLPTVSLGTGRTATALTAGNNHTCALLDNGTVKCWGSNGSGQLGLGDTNPRGDGANELGDNLPTVSLGTGHTALTVSGGGTHTCARLENSQVKCWGNNDSGQLGLGDTNPRGDGANELGDNLPTVDLGTGRTSAAVTAGADHTCAELDDGDVKCWGWNADGELGQGDTRRRGIAAGDMGDNLVAIPLPPVGRVSGTVRDASTNQPVGGVDVAVLRTADFGLVKVATATAGGAFTVDLRPGSYFLYLLDGTGTHREGFAGPPTTVTVTDRAATAVNPTMSPTRGAFSGTVTDQRTGLPVAGAMVFAIGPPGIVGRAVAGANGQYTLSGLTSGTYHAVFLDPVGGRAAEYYPNSVDYGGSAPINVVAGATTPGVDGSLTHP